jgi:hypothetical protein
VIRRDGLIGSCKSRHDQSTSQSVREGSRISAISSTTDRVLLGLLFAQDSACFQGLVFPEAAFASPMSVRVFSDAKTSLMEGFHGNLQAAGSCLYAIFFLLCRPVFWPNCLCVNLAGNLKWPNCCVWAAVGREAETRSCFFLLRTEK